MDNLKINFIIEEFFKKLCIDIESINVENEDDKIYKIILKTPDSNIVIWNHWKNLDEIRLLLRNILYKTFLENIIIHIEVNDYIQKKDDKLFSFIDNKIDIIKSTWKEIKLPFFNSYERKKIHSYISWLNDDNLYTKSVWEWKERRMYIWRKEEKITIDMDWVWI